MNIGIDASRPNEVQKTGTEWYAYHIIQQLKKIDKKNTNTLYSIDPLRDGLENLPANFTSRVLRSIGEFLWTQIRLSLEMLIRTPDVLFVPAHNIPLIHPQATVLTVHDLEFEHFPDLYKKTPIGPNNALVKVFFEIGARIATLGKYGNSEYDYQRWSMRFGVKHATRIIAISEFTKQDVVHRYGADPKRIAVISHAYDPVLYHPVKKDDRPKSTAIQKLSSYLLFVGRVERKKNISTLLAAYSELRRHSKEGPALVLIGKAGLGYEDFQKQVAKMNPGVKKDIHFLGWLPEEETAEFYRFAKAFVFPTNFEGFGIGVVQAMASGVPVVTSNVTSLPEVSGGAAILIDPRDQEGLTAAMKTVISNATKRNDMVIRGLRRAKQFSWEKSAVQTLAVIEQAYEDVNSRKHT